MPKIFKSEKGQALTEFAVAFPLVMLVFLIGMQLLFAANCVNVGHYAAFAAARSYAVTAGAGPGGEDNAGLKAELAAAMVYMPVSIPAKGEVDDAIASLIKKLITDLFAEMFGSAKDSEGIGDVFDNFIEDPGSLLSDLLTGGLEAVMDTVKEALVNELKDFIVDAAVDLFSDMFGGTFDDLVGANGSNPGFKLATAYFRLGFLADDLEIDEFYPQAEDGKDARVDQFTVNLHYRLPMAMPGFKAFWNMIRGYDIDEAFDKDNDDPLKEDYESGLNNAVFIIHTKCTMGYERWSGVYAGASKKDKKKSTLTKEDTEKKKKCFKEKEAELEKKSKRIKQIDEVELPQAKRDLAKCKQDQQNAPNLSCALLQAKVSGLESELNGLKKDVDNIVKSIRKDCENPK